MSVLDGSLSVCPKVIQIKLDKDAHGSLGFLLRGGSCVDNLKSRPLTVVHVRPGGPADREGTIKVIHSLFKHFYTSGSMTIIKYKDEFH